MAEMSRVQWDKTNCSHIARHKVMPKEAEQALHNAPFDLSYEVVNGEERWTSMGHTDRFRVLIVVWTIRGDEDIRVVTAREANKRERTTYLRGKGFGL